MDDFWEDSDGKYTGPALTVEAIRTAESALVCKLPEAYLSLLRLRNGGSPRRCCFPTSVPTSWAEDHILITTFLGIGYEWGIDGEFGSRYLIGEWGYPNVGIVIADTPSAGHDTAMLDYSECGPQGEPQVIHVETECDDPVITILAPDFEMFIRGLTDCSHYEG